MGNWEWEKQIIRQHWNTPWFWQNPFAPRIGIRAGSEPVEGLSISRGMPCMLRQAQDEQAVR